MDLSSVMFIWSLNSIFLIFSAKVSDNVFYCRARSQSDLTLVSIQGKLPSPPTKHSTLFYTPNLKHECGILFKMCPSDFRLVSYPQTKGSWKLSDLICPGQWPDTAAQFPPEPVATWGQGQAVHFATIGLSQRSYFSNRYESQFQQKVEIRHQIPPEI